MTFPQNILFPLCLVASVAAAAGVWMMSKDGYTATFQFRVASVGDAALTHDDRDASHDDYEFYKHTQRQFLMSDHVLNAALSDQQVLQLPIVRTQRDPVRSLASELRVEFPGDGDVMNVSLTADRPDESAMLVAAVSKSYLNEVANQERMGYSQRLREVELILHEKRRDRDSKRARMATLSEKPGAGDIQALLDKQRTTQEHLDAIRRELSSARAQVTKIKSEIELKKEQLERAKQADGERTKSPVLDESLRRRGLIYLDREVAQLEDELPKHVALEQQLAKDEARLSGELKSVASSSSAIENVQREINSLSEIMKPMEQRIHELNVQRQRPPRVTRLTRVKSDTVGAKTPDDRLTLREISAAIQPLAPDPNSRLPATIAAALAGWFLVPFAVVFLRLTHSLFTVAFPPIPLNPQPTPFPAPP